MIADRPTDDSSAERELTILLPCLNEVETLLACINKAQEFLRQSGIIGEVLVADNGSTDGSQELARSAGAQVVSVIPKGYGSALYYGARAARGRYIIMGDADGSYDFLNLGAFVTELRAGADLVVGNRFRGGILPGAMPWKNRYIGNPVLTFIGALLFRVPLGDFHCGQRAFSRHAFDRLDLRTTGMEYATEMIIKAAILGLKLAEVPVTLAPDGRSRRPHLRPWRDGWRHLRLMLVLSPRYLFLLPGLLLLGAGALLFFILWGEPLTVAGLRLDVHTLLFAALALQLGVQAVGLALIAESFAVRAGLIRPSSWWQGWHRFLRMETAMIAAGLLFGLGLAGAVYALFLWRAAGFGDLEGGEVMRVVIAAVLALALSVQVALVSFVLSLLELSARPQVD